MLYEHAGAGVRAAALASERNWYLISTRALQQKSAPAFSGPAGVGVCPIYSIINHGIAPSSVVTLPLPLSSARELWAQARPPRLPAGTAVDARQAHPISTNEWCGALFSGARQGLWGKLFGLLRQGHAPLGGLAVFFGLL